jgi:hypothetical protein
MDSSRRAESGQRDSGSDERTPMPPRIRGSNVSPRPPRRRSVSPRNSPPPSQDPRNGASILGLEAYDSDSSDDLSKSPDDNVGEAAPLDSSKTPVPRDRFNFADITTTDTAADAKDKAPPLGLFDPPRSSRKRAASSTLTRPPKPQPETFSSPKVLQAGESDSATEVDSDEEVQSPAQHTGKAAPQSATGLTFDDGSENSKHEGHSVAKITYSADAYVEYLKILTSVMKTVAENPPKDEDEDDEAYDDIPCGICSTTGGEAKWYECEDPECKSRWYHEHCLSHFSLQATDRHGECTTPSYVCNGLLTSYQRTGYVRPAIGVAAREPIMKSTVLLQFPSLLQVRLSSRFERKQQTGRMIWWKAVQRSKRKSLEWMRS